MKTNFNIYMVLAVLLGSIGYVHAQQGDWKPLGPVNFPVNLMGQAGGITRTSQVKFHPKDPLTMYTISVRGGLFISRDGGKRWVPGGTDSFSSTRFASVCVDHTDDKVMYVSTGDPHYYWETRTGIYKTRDGGKTWKQRTNGIGNRMAVELLMSPFDNKVLIAATNDGIWKSNDSGATWSVKRVGGEFTDMVFKPGPQGKSKTIYAASKTQFFRSDNLGDSWTPVTLPGTGHEINGRIGVSKADSSIVYVTFTGNFNGFPTNTCTPALKSKDSGVSFDIVKPAGLPNLQGYRDFESGFDWYAYAFTVDPANPNILYAGGHILNKSTDGGVTWNNNYHTWPHKLHTDYHQFVFSPHDSKKLYSANDGGVFVSVNGGESWEQCSDGLAGLESGNAAQSPAVKEVLAAGAQDNGELHYLNGVWYQNAIYDYHNKLTFSYTKTPFRYDLAAGERKHLALDYKERLNFPFSPGTDGKNVEMAFTPLDTNIAYLGMSSLYRTTNLTSTSVSWTPIFTPDGFASIKGIAISPNNRAIVYVVTNDNRVFRSTNALDASPVFNPLPAAPSNTWDASISVSRQEVAYLSCGPYVYQYSSSNPTWSNITGSLPGGVNIIKVISDIYSTDGSVYLATALGVYYRNNSLGNWVSYTKGLPKSANITQLMIYNDGSAASELRACLDGRGIFTTSLYGKAPILRTPENPATATSAGLAYSYYEGTWRNLPNFNSLTPVKKGTTTATPFDLSQRNRDDQFGFVYKGYINITSSGHYTFYLNTDDGSRLYIGDQLVVDRDGIRSSSADVTGLIGLKAGKHAIEIHYFENSGSQYLNASISGPAFPTKQAIPSSILFRTPDEVQCTGTGLVYAEQWKNLRDGTMTSVPWVEAPSVIYPLQSTLSVNYERGDYFGERVRGYICAPYSGNYTFYVTGGDHTEFWLSSNELPSGKLLRSSLSSQTGQTAWHMYPSQKSDPITLTAGQKYYFEVLHKENQGTDHYAVAWQLPDGRFEGPIPVSRLSPYSPINHGPEVSLDTPYDDDIRIPGTTLTLNATARDMAGGRGIARVEFYRNGLKIGQDLTSPYSYSIPSITAGNHIFHAKAINMDSLTAVSYRTSIKVENYRIPENPASTQQGVNYKYYQNVDRNTDLNSSPVIRTGTFTNFDITNYAGVNDFYGYQYNAYINVPVDGLYTFYSFADDQCKIYFGTSTTPILTSTHGAYEKESPKVALKAGKHLIRVEFVNEWGGRELYVLWSGPGVNKQIIPSSSLYRTNTAKIATGLNETEATDISIGRSSASFITIAPNPAEDVFTITATKDIRSLSVTDLLGSEVYGTSGVQNGRSASFGKDFAGGIYNVTVVYEDNSRETFKVVKNK